jgi:hypothetical protein
MGEVHPFASRDGILASLDQMAIQKQVKDIGKA